MSGIMLRVVDRSAWARNLSQCHFVHRKSHIDWLGIELGAARSEDGD